MEYGVQYRNAEEKQERPQEEETLQEIPCEYLASTRQQRRKKLYTASLRLLKFVHGKKTGNSFLCIEVDKFNERTVALQTHMPPEDMLLAFAA